MPNGAIPVLPCVLTHFVYQPGVSTLGVAAVVERIFDEFTRAYIRAGLSKIAEELNTDSVPTQRPGGRWFASTIKYMLYNATYATEPLAIISRATYDRAQSRLASMQRGPTR